MRPLAGAGRKLIQDFERCVLHPYDDHDGASIKFVNGVWRRPDGAAILGYPTTGWGHVIRPGDPPDLFGPIAQSRADGLFDLDLVPYVSAVDRNLPGCNDHQRAAASSFTYNCGTGGLVASGIPAAFQTGRDPKSEWTTKKWTISKGQVLAGLVRRRAQEYALYMTPDELSAADAAQVLAWVATAAQQIESDLLGPGAHA